MKNKRNRRTKALAAAVAVTGVVLLVLAAALLPPVENAVKSLLPSFGETAETSAPPAETTTEDATAETQTEAPSETTSAAPRERTVTISFVGDCMFASNLESTAYESFNGYASREDADYFLGGVADIFKNDDYTIANCECVLSDNSLSPKERTSEVQFWFKGKASYAEFFSVAGVDFCSTTNNHSYDYGEQGYYDTLDSLRNAGIEAGVRGEYTKTEIGGIPAGIYACSLYCYDDVFDILDKLYAMEDDGCELKIIYFHGGIEGESEPETWLISACRRLADEGADLVVGSHPHVLRPTEEYNGCKIVYSLGNFCFGGNIAPKNRTAIYRAEYTVLDGVITGRRDEIIPCYVYTGSQNNYRPEIIGDEEIKNAVLEFMG